MSKELSLEEVECTVEEFKKEYFSDGPFSSYMNGCGISTLGVKGVNVPDDQKDCWCIFVTLREELPSGLEFPGEYQGVPVVAEVVGEINLL